MARPRRTEQLADLTDPICEDYVVHIDAVRSARASLPRIEELSHLTALFAALGDPTRLRIVSALAAHELCVCDIAAAIGMTESAVSHQLKQLRKLGLVRHRRDGRLALYALDDEHVTGIYRQAIEHVAHQAEAASE